MENMNYIKRVFSNTWRVLVVAFIFTIGLIVSRIIFHQFGLTPPRLPQQADESTAIYYLLSGSVLLSISILPLAAKIGGTFITRFFIIFFFFFACFGISVSLESSIYSNIAVYGTMMLILFLPIMLCSFGSTWLTNSQSEIETFSRKSLYFFKTQKPMEWVWRSLLSIFSFPITYLIFGIIVSPFVVDYYRENNYGLAVPAIGIIIAVQMIRSILFLIATIPIMIAWFGTKFQLFMALTIAHFLFVFSFDIVLAYELPYKLVLIHAIEIFIDSIIYSWVIVKLLYMDRLASNSVRNFVSDN